MRNDNEPIQDTTKGGIVLTSIKNLGTITFYVLFIYGMGALAAWLPPKGYYSYSRLRVTAIAGTAGILATAVGTQALKRLYRVPKGMNLRDGMFLKWTEDEMKRCGNNPAAKLVLESYSEKLKKGRGETQRPTADTPESE